MKAEVAELYGTNEAVSLADETELRGVLPNPKQLPLPSEFEALVQERRELATHDLRYRMDLWEGSPAVEHLGILENLSEKLRQAALLINGCEPWQLGAMLSVIDPFFWTEKSLFLNGGRH